MHDFPFAGCPTAFELGAFLGGTISDEDLERLSWLEAHIDSCARCARAVGAGGPSTEIDLARFARAPTDAASVVDAQQLLRDAISSAGARPAPAELWVTHFTPQSRACAPSAERWVVLVLDRHYREYTQEWGAEVFPVTLRGVGPADWSYVAPADSSEWGDPLTVHVDFHFSCAAPALARRLARLSEPWFREIRMMYEQYASGHDAPDPPRHGAVGSVWQRRTLGWKTFEEAAFALISDAAFPLPPEQFVPAAEPGSAAAPVTGTHVGLARSEMRLSTPCEAPTTPLRLSRSPTAERYLVHSTRSPLNECGQASDSACSIGELIERLRSEVQSGRCLTNPRVNLTLAEDLLALESLPRLTGTPSPEEVIRYVKRETGQPISLLAALLVVEAHIAAGAQEAGPAAAPRALQRAARRASRKDPGA